jgi:hypothetical protein
MQPKTTKEERAHHVRQMLTNQRLEGFEPDEAHQQLLQGYIEGTTSLADLLKHACAYAEMQTGGTPPSVSA